MIGSPAGTSRLLDTACAFWTHPSAFMLRAPSLAKRPVVNILSVASSRPQTTGTDLKGTSR
jgi:hypothetical protein